MGLLTAAYSRHNLAVAVFTSAAVIFAALLVPAGSMAGSSYPERIISLGPIITENVFLLGAGKRLVGDTIYCVRPEEARLREKIGSLMEINIEKILALKPDLVLATALTSPSQVQKLKGLGLRVVRFPKPGSFNAVCSQLLELGRLLGLEGRAEEIVREVEEETGCITSKVSGLPRKKVLLQVGADPLFVSVPGSFTNDYIELAGGINVAADQTTGLFGMEKALVKDPDVIIIAVMGSETGTAAREKERWLSYRSINAVKNEKVYTVNPDIICSPSPCTFVLALRKLTALIHPDAVKGLDDCRFAKGVCR